jgi:hypothetical protein
MCELTSAVQRWYEGDLPAFGTVGEWQGTGRVVAGLWQGTGSVMAGLWQGTGSVVAGLQQGNGMVCVN